MLISIKIEPVAAITICDGPRLWFVPRQEWPVGAGA